ncbi:hypothetical protein [Hymenobacter norwichensis]|uniref:hypothetical protein n=1 Tax=Hymenobacter norwichensis TaxID=223903 RepID=UPI0003B5A425|nr:hypothetical protein [Hymenobacter norwichensis]
MSQLQLFAARALRALPTSLWWVLGALVGALLSIRLENEVFPHTPAAARLAYWIVRLCVVVLPPLGVVWLWRVAAGVGHAGWRLLWYMAALGATGLSVGMLLLLLFGLIVWL